LAKDYVHGYHESENLRLQDQANSLVELLHNDTYFPPGSLVLEAGCGIGAQTVTLAKNSPGARIIAVDISKDSLTEAKTRINAAGIENVEFRQENIFKLTFPLDHFDHIFVCFVLEHLTNPSQGLSVLKKYLKEDGRLTVIEGDHGSTYFYPDSEEAHRAIQSQVELQKRLGGDANIGRRLYPLLAEAGFRSIKVSPRMVYVDGSKPDLIEGFTKNTFTAMIKAIRQKAVTEGITTPKQFDKGIKDLYRTANPDGVFCYTFFKGTALK
jgi:ubiquinone/menaquinone biosynthesis C-methylase UbiE